MIKYEFKDNDGKNWVRISKVQARKLFERGEKIVFCPCKSRPFGWIPSGIVMEQDYYWTFQGAVEGFEFCNCNAETGKYVSFYKMEV